MRYFLGIIPLGRESSAFGYAQALDGTWTDYKKATAMLENLIATQCDNEGYFDITTSKTGKYGRWIVDIKNVNSVLAEKWPY